MPESGPGSRPAKRAVKEAMAKRRRCIRTRWLHDRWLRGLAGIALGGLILRCWVVLIARPSCSPDPTQTGCFRLNGDAFYHFTQGRLIGDGHFFKNGLEHLATGRLVDSAGDPPGFALLLGAWSALGFDTLTWQRFMLTLVGTSTVVLIALLARRLGGDRAGWIAALLAALHPLLWINDAMLMSESFYQPVIVITLLLATAYGQGPSRRLAAWVGALIGLAALVRGEAMLLGLFLLAPLVGLARALPRSERVKQLFIGAAAAVAVVAPWVVYNNIRFAEVVTLTSTTGNVLLAGSCETAWSGPSMGYWANCFAEDDLWEAYEQAFPGITARGDERVIYDESLIDRFNRDHALDWIGDNLRRWPEVMLARVGRALEFYRVADTLHWSWALEGRWKGPSTFGLGLYYLLILPSAYGMWLMRRAGQRLTPLLATWPVVIVSAALTFGLTRYRVPVDIAMIVLASIALASLRLPGKRADVRLIPRMTALRHHEPLDMSPPT